MDILISLLYTGAQDGWVTINGRARRSLENKERRGGARGGASEGKGVGGGGGFRDDASHLGLDLPVNTQRRTGTS